MWKLVSGFLMIAALALGQATQNTTIQPDCWIPFTVTAAGNFPVSVAANGPGDNRTKGCAAWTLMYQSTGLTGVSVTLQSGSSPTTTVSFGSFAGTVSMGYANPIVSDTGGSLQATNGTADISWVRVSVAATGSGTLNGVLYGFRNSSAAVSGGGGGACTSGGEGSIQYNNMGAFGCSPNLTYDGQNFVVGNYQDYTFTGSPNDGYPANFAFNLRANAINQFLIGGFAYNVYLNGFNTTQYTGPGSYIDFYGGTASAPIVSGWDGTSYLETGTITSYFAGLLGYTSIYGGTTPVLAAVYGELDFYGDDGDGGEVTDWASAFYATRPRTDGGATTYRSYAAFYSDHVEDGTQPNYFLFYNGNQTGEGVWRVDRNGVEAYYNPAYTTYTPGSTDYERVVTQWNTNTIEIGAEASGMGTLRQVQQIGNGWIAVSYAFAALGSLTNGTYKYCSDCTVTSGVNNTCAASGTGAWAERINGAWKCYQ